MSRVLVTGMSGTGKSSALAELGRRGFRVVDTDEPGWREYREYVESSDELHRGEWLWVEERTPVERAMILDDLARVEPRLREGCTHELDASRPVADIVADLTVIASRPMTTS